MELLMKYSGITAIIVYSLLLLILLRFRKSERKDEPQEETQPSPSVSRLDISDEEATVAALIACIDYRQEKGTDVRVVSIREVR